MVNRIPLQSAAEVDAFEHAREINWKAAERRALKRAYRRRERKESRLALRNKVRRSTP